MNRRKVPAVKSTKYMYIEASGIRLVTPTTYDNKHADWPVAPRVNKPA